MSEIKFLKISNHIGMEVTLSTLGASFYRILINDEDMILTPKDKNLFCHNDKYYGLTIGRIAGRMKNGLLRVDGNTYQLEQNEGMNSLHGGDHSICYRNWDYRTFRNKEYIGVNFHLSTNDGEAGYNGNAEYYVEYHIYLDSNVIEVLYGARCDQDTYFNMTNHAYFNLGNAKDILSHKLLIKADKVSIFDDDFSIKGYREVKNPIFDFSKMKEIGKDINDNKLQFGYLHGYDHRFHLTDKTVILKNGKKELTIESDFDGLQFYSGGFTNHDELLNGDHDDEYKGAALEPHNIYPEKVKKNEYYHHKIKYTFKV